MAMVWDGRTGPWGDAWRKRDEAYHDAARRFDDDPNAAYRRRARLLRKAEADYRVTASRLRAEFDALLDAGGDAT